MTPTCTVCAGPMPHGKRPDARYCSSTCRATAEKRRSRERKTGRATNVRGPYAVPRRDYEAKLEATRLRANARYQTAVYGCPTPDPLQMTKDPYARARAAGYRSGLEVKVADSLRARGCTDFTYEQHVVPYEVPARKARYTPDVVLPNGIVVETKGRWVTEDRKKIGLIKAQHPGLDLRIVFANPNARISKTSKTTYAMVCEKLGIPFAAKDVPSAWLEEAPNEVSLAILEGLRK